jgi:hypothetical protein
MHFGVILLEWKMLPIDGQVAGFLYGSQTICGSFDVLHLQKVISDCGKRFRKRLSTLSVQYVAPFSAPSKLFNISKRDI